MKQRIHAFAIHLAISCVIALGVAAFTFFCWYPHPYRSLSGGLELFLMIMAIDVIVGPLVTLVIYNEKKSRRAIRFDYGVIAFVQFMALGYGMWTLAQARPVHMVFEKDLFRVVHAADVDARALGKLHPGVVPLPWNGPSWLAVRMPSDPMQRDQVLTRALMGTYEAFQPQLWVPYAESREEVLAAAHPAQALAQQFPELSPMLEQLAKEFNVAKTAIRYLPVVGRNFVVWTVFLDAEANPMGYAAFDSLKP
ncbi:pilus assembly protein [Vandammella animalimorsus]|uniref:Pilus assembly protein n=1 Tax=Vandammella animalimorsus TaxID=2029117 RepID=A0A2A2T539_9BURK|nr:TfpX/TfpZ family type IV pilin accessory protein [Vandammella animalimorsus]PAT32262.1 pilus assembly protein [Vandammella animalimorsus]PAX16613.1 pilus assembly protein [Vandammella animalimorsus]PAX19243.1 pilus assembly protein [Vandammella animalimorsus]